MIVSTFAMYDCHNFQKIDGLSVEGLILDWLNKNREETMAMYEDQDFEVNIGRACLCPATILDDNGKEIRRVGCMVEWMDFEAMHRWRRLCNADPDMSRILRERRLK